MVFRLRTALVAAIPGVVVLGLGGCPPGTTPDPNAPVYNNTTDKTNNNARYIGSAACRACHPDADAAQIIHGHAHKLTRVTGGPPVFPIVGVTVPNPPAGFSWADISYVIGGYTKKARFIDQQGFIITTGFNGVNPQWNLAFPPNGTTGGFVPYEPTAGARKSYDFQCFQCHTTGPTRQDEDLLQHQDNRAGIPGSWQEPGIQCEECHGPGGNHVPNPPARDIFVDLTGTATCNTCHNRPYDSLSGVIQSKQGYIDHHEQWPELLASGGHSAFTCITCHDPHTSVTYDRANALRQQCIDCHPNQNMALHAGKTFVRGSYVEPLTCESCHMPYVTKSATNAPASVVGQTGRMGDTRTHIFRINTNPVDFRGMFTADLLAVARDEQGRAAVTVDFVCLRCHTDNTAADNSAFVLPLDSASEIALQIHQTSASLGR
ncbi:MAG: multiheme c-type cytochrome [Planctomycetota bacterium]